MAGLAGCYLAKICLLNVSGWYEDNWFEVNLDKENIDCTVEEMRMAAEGKNSHCANIFFHYITQTSF